MIPRYVLGIAPLAAIARTPIFLWYAHKAVPPELRMALPWVKRVFTSHVHSLLIETPKKVVLGQGIDTDLFRPCTQASSRSVFRFCYLARLSPIKDQALVVEAVRLLCLQHVLSGNFVVDFLGDAYAEGDKEYREVLKRKVEQYALGSTIRFRGAIAHQSLPILLSNYDAGLCVSHTTTLEKSALETMACGLPTLVCNEALREMVGEWDSLLFFKEGRVEDLAAKMEQLLVTSTEERQRIGQTLRQRVTQGHSVDHLAQGIFNEINRIFLN